jgi:hypothetical protein
LNVNVEYANLSILLHRLDCCDAEKKLDGEKGAEELARLSRKIPSLRHSCSSKQSPTSSRSTCRALRRIQ